MNRRGFLSGMFASAMAPAVVRASSIMRIKPLVLPGEAEFVAVASALPATGNTFLSAAMVAKEALSILEDQLRFLDDMPQRNVIAANGKRTISIRRPPRYQATARC